MVAFTSQSKMSSQKTPFKQLKTATLITGAISLVLLSCTTAQAESKKEKCAGIVKAGLNDCASAEHICAGMNSDDSNDTDWLWLPAGTCKKIVGAHLIVKKENVESADNTNQKDKESKKSKKKS